MAVAGRTAAGGFFQAAAPPADPERGQELPHIRAQTGFTPDVALFPDTDERFETSPAVAAEVFVYRHRFAIPPRSD